MAEPHAFDIHLEHARAWLKPMIEDLQLKPGDHACAVHALRAGLHAIRDRLPAAEVVDLAAQLPTLMRGIYYEGWKLDNDPTRIRSPAAMLARVQAELGPDLRLEPRDVLRSVVRLLVKHVSPGEIRDVLATLPRSIAALWREFSGDTPAPSSPSSDARVRRTGYAR